jgi:hypothetical protein
MNLLEKLLTAAVSAKPGTRVIGVVKQLPTELLWPPK